MGHASGYRSDVHQAATSQPRAVKKKSEASGASVLIPQSFSYWPALDSRFGEWNDGRQAPGLGYGGGCWLASRLPPSIAFVMTHAAQPRAIAKLTVLEFAVHPAAAGPSELVGGEIRMMAPASGAHGAVAGAIFAAVNAFVEERQLGVCFPDNTGFALPGVENTVRSPDMAFVRADRLPVHGLGSGFVEVAPDLVVEVLSPTESASDLEEKLRDYGTAGTTLVWVIDPARRVVVVRAAGVPVRWLGGNDLLDGGSVLPRFSIAVAGLFARLALV